MLAQIHKKVFVSLSGDRYLGWNQHGVLAKATLNARAQQAVLSVLSGKIRLNGLLVHVYISFYATILIVMTFSTMPWLHG
jgi:hypothetical protein